MNETLRTIHERRSTRAFKSDPVPRELIEQIVDAGIWAPSGMNKQAAIVVAITDTETRNRLAAANRAIGGWGEGVDPFYGAPVILVVLADKSVHTSLYDGSLVMGNMMLAAESLGLGSIWIHRAQQEFEQDEWKAFLADLGIEGEWEGIGHCAVGYIDKPTEARPRQIGRVFWIE